MFQYLKGDYKEGGDSLFRRRHMEKTGVMAQVAPGEIPGGHKRKIFHNESNQLLE